MTDNELLASAAFAVNRGAWHPLTHDTPNGMWNPLTDDGDAFRLAVKLRLTINPYQQGVFVSRYEDEDVIAEPFDVPECNGEATRRAIVRAAASMAQEKTK